MDELAHSEWMDVYIDVLPAAGGNGVCFVHDSEMWVLFDGFVPPVPTHTVRLPTSECVEMFNAFPVGYSNDCSGVCSNETRGFSQVFS